MECIPPRNFALDERVSDPNRQSQSPNTLAAADKTGALRSSSQKRDSYVARTAVRSKMARHLRRSSSLESTKHLNDAIKKNTTTTVNPAEPWLYHKRGFVLSIANRSTLTKGHGIKHLYADGPPRIEKSLPNRRGTVVKGQLQSKKKGPSRFGDYNNIIISGNAATIASPHPTDDGYQTRLSGRYTGPMTAKYQNSPRATKQIVAS